MIQSVFPRSLQNPEAQQKNSQVAKARQNVNPSQVAKKVLVGFKRERKWEKLGELNQSRIRERGGVDLGIFI